MQISSDTKTHSSYSVLCERFGTEEKKCSNWHSVKCEVSIQDQNHRNSQVNRKKDIVHDNTANVLNNTGKSTLFHYGKCLKNKKNTLSFKCYKDLELFSISFWRLSEFFLFVNTFKVVSHHFPQLNFVRATSQSDTTHVFDLLWFNCITWLWKANKKCLYCHVLLGRCCCWC